MEETKQPPKLFKLPKPPEGVEYACGNECEDFNDCEIESFPDGCDVAAYWYVSGSYEGSGHIVYRVNGKWNHHNCGHCSCYGPLESIDNEGREETLDELAQNCSDGLLEEGISALITVLKENGYQ